jgi:hypothetical protein
MDNTQEERRQRDSPSPQTHRTLEAFNFASSPRTRQIQSKAKRESFVDVAVRKSISPGPCKTTVSDKCLNMLSKGFSSRGRLS